MIVEKTIAKAIREVNSSLAKIAVFDSFMNSAIVFLLAYLALSLSGRVPLSEDRVLFSALASLVSFGAWSAWKLRKSRIRRVEEKFPFLNEKFRTSADNASADSEVARALHQEVLADLGNVYEGAFFSDRLTYGKALAIIALSFLLLMAPPLAGKVLNLHILKDRSGAAVLGENTEADANYVTGGPGGAGSFEQEPELTGTVAMLGNRQLNVTIRQSGYRMNLRSVGKAEERSFYESYPAEVSAPGSVDPFAENIPTEQEELVKRYFENLAK